MCGTAIKPHLNLDFEGRKDQFFVAGDRIRKSKSLQDLAQSEVVIGKYTLQIMARNLVNDGTNLT